LVQLPAQANLMTAPPPRRNIMLSQQDFDILMESAGSPRDASVRDLSFGFAGSCILALIGIVAGIATSSVDSPLWLLLCIVALMCFTVASIALGLYAASRTKHDKGRQSYVRLLERIKTDLVVKD
jgi:hypothetical protein